MNGRSNGAKGKRAAGRLARALVLVLAPLAALGCGRPPAGPAQEIEFRPVVVSSREAATPVTVEDEGRTLYFGPARTFRVATARLGRSEVGYPAVDVELVRDDHEPLAAATREWMDEEVALFFEGEFLTVATMHQPLTRGRVRIVGRPSEPFTGARAAELADRLRR